MRRRTIIKVIIFINSFIYSFVATTMIVLLFFTKWGWGPTTTIHEQEIITMVAAAVPGNKTWTTIQNWVDGRWRWRSSIII